MEMVSHNSCFRIRNLTRVFGPNLVLYVPKLDIPRGKLVVILGDSGSGKTTLIETLGLLSQAYSTILTDSQIVYYPESNNRGYDYRDLWCDEAKLNRLRLENMAFMFQHPNLIPAYNIRDNIALSSVIQGESIADTRIKADNLISRIYNRKDPKAIKDFGNKYSNELSGGEQQRAAFARAIAKNSKVFFADEPAGNIGRRDAHNVFSLIRGYVDNKSDLVETDGKDVEKRTAIIVTHNLLMPLHYADQIIVLDQNGFIRQDNIFDCSFDDYGKRIWPHLFNADLPIEGKQQSRTDRYTTAQERLIFLMKNHGSFRNLPINDNGYIRKKNGDIYKPHELKNDDWNLLASEPRGENPEPEVSDVLSTSEMASVRKGYSRNFQKLFLKGKYRDLSIGSRNSVMMMITLIIVFLSIGIGRGGLIELNKKMSSPFVRYLDITLSKTNIERISPIIDSLETKATREDFHIESAKSYFRFTKNIWSEPNHDYTAVWFRTIELDDPLLKEITDEKNLICGKGFDIEQTIGLIVCEDYIKKHCQSDRPDFIYIRHHKPEETIPIPVVAIVKHLPGKVKVMSTRYFYDQYMNNGLNPANTHELIVFSELDYERAWGIKKKLERFFRDRTDQYDHLGPQIMEPVKYIESWRKGHQVRVSFRKDEDVDYLSIRGIYNEIIRLPELESDNLMLMYDYTPLHYYTPRKDENISIFLENTNSVKDLRNYMTSKFDIDVDMASIEVLDNYNYVTRLTTVLAFAVIIISIIGITLFVANILMEHLSNNRVFIGIFTALGISDETMQSLYQKRMIPFAFKNIVIAFLGSSLLG